MTKPSAVAVPVSPSATLWTTAQWVGVLATLLLLAGLIARPDTALTVLWNVLIPLVPASLLISPALWRNTCPLATLSMAANRSDRTLSATMLRRAGLMGILLLALMVPARRFLFNTDGTALAITIAAVVVLAIILGTAFQLKAGFCNAVCPVLPVERLYGQHPLVRVGNPRCTPCTMCTATGCLDLNPRKSIARTVGDSYHSSAWLTGGYGTFAAAFPGFVIGYYTTQDGSWASAGSVYLNVAMWAAISYVTTLIVVSTMKANAARTMTVLAAAAIGLYYWYAAAAVTTALDIRGVTTLGIRIAAFGLIAFWLWRAWAHPVTNGARPRNQPA
jgi:nitrite reductase (NADH) large subunit